MIPNDPAMLLSYINTQLRDHYDSLEDLCLSLAIESASIIEKLKTIDYVYDQQQNQFV